VVYGVGGSCDVGVRAIVAWCGGSGGVEGGAVVVVGGGGGWG